jgi:hypothetical protein
MQARLIALLCAALQGLAACSDAQEAQRVELQLLTDGEGLEVITTDLGYEVELRSAAVAVDDVKFTIAGETHASLLRRLSDALVPVAHAHPGHFQGGEVTGELPGHFLLRFSAGETREVGTATLLVGSYHSVNMTLAYATSSDAPEGDPIVGHTAVLDGLATRDEQAIEFRVVIDSPIGRELVGVPFEEEITTDSRQRLALRLFTRDPLENDSLFDGVDFMLLDTDGDGALVIEQSDSDPANVAACHTVRRILQSHDHFAVQSSTAEDSQ